MTKNLSKVFSLIAILALMFAGMPMQHVQAAGTVSLTTLNSAYTQDFNTLASTPDAGTSSTIPTGWDFSETGSNANTTYGIGTGSNNAGNTYSFGSTASAERAFGGLRSGSLIPIIGASFTNNTGSTVTSIDISYIGEMWRAGVTNRNAADRLDFQLSTNATSLTTGTWVDYNSLDYNSSNINATSGALNGNSSLNQTSVSFSITGLSIANSTSFWIRWTDFDISLADDGLAVDTFSITPRVVDFAPEVDGTYPVNGATDFPINANLTVSFNEPVNVSDPWYTLVCSVSGPGGVPTTFSGGLTDFTIDPSIPLANGETCTLTIVANQVSDVDGNDPPDNMVMNFVVGFSPFDVCAAPFTPIYTIQGNGLSTPIPGTVTTKGVVVGDFEGATSVGIQGFYVQDLSGDGDPSTSDGIFVFTDTANLASVGQVVRVSGYARERFGQTTLNGSNSDSSAVPAANVIQCGTGSVTATDVTMPFTDADYPERFEGMLVRFPQNLVISEYFNYDRFGEMVIGLPLDGYDRFYNPTSITNPGPAAQALLDEYALRQVTLDDGLGSSGPAVLRHPNGDPFSSTNRFRGGDTITNTTGVLGYDFGLYRIQPTAPATYNEVNLRPASPSNVGGTIKVASYNVLNYFLTVDTTSSNNSGPCGPLQNQDCRGADSASEFARQRSKLMQALTAIDADIYGLIELENTTGVDTPGDIVNGLNAATSAGTFASINTGTIGGDAIRVGIIYKPGKVTPVGLFQTLDSADDPRFIDNKNRPSLAQTFQVNDTGARFTVVVNHLKSKGSDCNDIGDPDTGDGQGNCNQTRLAAAQALVDWLATDPTSSGDSDFLVIGDMNSYAREDPIAAIKAGADDTANTNDDFVNMVATRLGALAYSYVFDGQAGYLDHALSSNSLDAQVMGVTDWHLNADEPDIFDYNDAILTTGELSSERRGLDVTDTSSPFRTSDHDPVIVGLNPLHYNFTGFFQPVDNTPVLNSVKAGNSIPVKFSLSGNQGLDIFLNGYPLSRQIACDLSAPLDDIEQTVTAGGSSLSYDAITDQYSYVWKTDKAWAGTCRQLVVILKDGSVHYANFKFK